MELMLDPLSRKLSDAPMEDEVITDAEEQAVAEARTWLNQNAPILHQELLDDLGLTLADFETLNKMPQPDASSRGRSHREGRRMEPQSQPIPHEKVLADFGLTEEDWARMSRET